MTYVDRIVSRFGSRADMARAMGHQNATTIQGWQDRGTIPSRRIPEVLAAAKAHGLDLKLADFFPAVDREDAA